MYSNHNDNCGITHTSNVYHVWGYQMTTVKIAYNVGWRLTLF